MVLHDLRIEEAGRTAQIDQLLVNRFLEFYVLESKSFGNGIAINEQGEFTTWIGNRPVGTASPIEQNRRHIDVLDDLLRRADAQAPGNSTNADTKVVCPCVERRKYHATVKVEIQHWRSRQSRGARNIGRQGNRREKLGDHSRQRDKISCVGNHRDHSASAAVGASAHHLRPPRQVWYRAIFNQ